MVRGFCLRAFGVKPWGRGHVEPFLRTNAVGVVHKHEWGGLCLFSSFLNAGGSVCFVAENNVKRRRALLLCTLDDWERMIGAEYHCHRVLVCFLQCIQRSLTDLW